MEKCKIIHKPDYIVGFFAFDANIAKHLVNVFADGKLRNDGELFLEVNYGVF